MPKMDDKASVFRYGQTNPDTGLICLGRAKSCKDGLRWCTPEKFIERKAAISDYKKRENVREHTKILRNTDHERSKRNSYARQKRAENPKYRGENIEGRIFGMLTAIAVAGSRDYGGGAPYHGGKKRLWSCKCECGNTTEVATGSLLKAVGGTKSCGCRSAEVAIENSKKSRHKIMKPEAAFNAIYGIYKSNAKKRGLEWDLSFEQAKALFNGDCNYCGLPPSNTHKPKGYHQKYSGIDRLDNAKGYAIENTVSCCSICNHAKHTIGESDFVAWIFKAANHLKNKMDSEYSAREAKP